MFMFTTALLQSMNVIANVKMKFGSMRHLFQENKYYNETKRMIKMYA